MHALATLTAAAVLAVALAAPAAKAACEVPLLGQDQLPDDPLCGPVDLSPPAGQPAPPPPPPKIVAWTSGYDVNPFDGDRAGIWVGRADGTQKRKLTSFANPNNDFEPHGLNLPDDHPSFSFDNRRIVFTSNRASSTNWDIYTMNVNGSGVTRLTSAAGVDTEPVFSPDGSKIAFATERFGNLDIAVMNANGTGVQRLTTSSFEDIEPAWRPDGQEIAFSRILPGNNKEIFVMRPDGTGQRQVTFLGGEDHDPSYGPDGQQLVITSERAPFSPPFGNVHKIRASDGASLSDLTADLDFGAGDPFWSRDGSIVAFFKSVLPVIGPQAIFVMPANGGGKFHFPGEASVNVHPAIGTAIDDDSDGTPNYLEGGSPGRAALAPRSVRAARRSILRFSWTHPRSWRALDTLSLRLSQGTRLLGIVRHSVGDRSFSLFDERRNLFLPAAPLGRRVLRSPLLSLDLRRTRVVDASRRRIVLELAVRFRRRFAGERLRVRVQARDLDGRHREEEFGRLRVTR